MEMTLRWARRSKEYFESHQHEVPWANSIDRRQTIFGIVQGGMHPDLRRESAERTVEMDFPGYAIGGLSVGEPRQQTLGMIAPTIQGDPQNQPPYPVGVGCSDEVTRYAAVCVAIVDCVL